MLIESYLCKIRTFGRGAIMYENNSVDMDCTSLGIKNM